MVPDRVAADPSEAFRRHGVVFEGSINPAIFQPKWLAAIGLLSVDEADTAEPPLVSPSVTAFRTEGLSVQVTSERAVFRTRGEQLTQIGLGELVAGIFRELPHTPITSLDLVHEAHVPTESLSWSRAREALVPHRDAVLPGAEIAMLELEVGDEDGSSVQLFLEASDELEDGVYVRVHREFALEPADHGSAGQALEVLQAHWHGSLDGASTILGRMITAFA